MKTLIHTDKEQIESIIRQSDVCFVGMADTDGTPYVLPMNFGPKVLGLGILSTTG